MRNVDGLRSGGTGVDGEDCFTVVAAAAAVASVAAVASLLSKVFVGAVSTSQVG